MSVLLINAKFELLSLFWAIAIFFLASSVFLCFGIIIRRILRNRNARKRAKQKAAFQAYVVEFINEVSVDNHHRRMPTCHIHEMTDVLLHYFQTLKGKKKETLQDMISGTDIEGKIVESTKHGTRGVRMRAVRVLSYLNSQNSLQVIFKSLSSEDKYIRLTAMRSLVKRKARFFLNAIIESCLEAFPSDYKLLSGILSNFGNEIIEPLEEIIRTSKNETLVTASLETLILIMPMRTSVDFDRLMKHANEDIRAAALSLSAITKHDAPVNPQLLGLTDSSTKVKIRAAKMANRLKRSDLTSPLYELSSDPVLWVRYWALRGIWVSGTSGEKLVTSMTKTNPTAKNVALEMSSGYV